VTLVNTGDDVGAVCVTPIDAGRCVIAYLLETMTSEELRVVSVTISGTTITDVGDDTVVDGDVDTAQNFSNYVGIGTYQAG
jgi:hypothetical protein